MSSLLDEKQHLTFLNNLFRWYADAGRHDMPWRKTKDAYAILVSEFMLQQTTVATVRPYYDRFLRRFPTLKSLASSDLNDVLALWSGLGYYARARNLWAAAQAVEEKCEGRVPSDTNELMKLPGVGAYTAGAISSLAFNKPAPVLDANILRVFMRLLALEEHPKLKAVQVILRKLSLELGEKSLKQARKKRVKKNGPRDLVLALMDLGATLCSPSAPQCRLCPVARHCLAKKFGRQEEIPPRDEELERPTVRRLYGIVEHKGKWLVGQRPTEGLFGGLWEFLGVDVASGIEPVLQLEEAIQRETGNQTRVQQALPIFDHQLSHRHYVIRPFRCVLRNEGKPLIGTKRSVLYTRFKWVSPTQLTKMGLSSITKRIISALKQKI